VKANVAKNVLAATFWLNYMPNKGFKKWPEVPADSFTEGPDLPAHKRLPIPFPAPIH
jgi:hypothetical protein